MGRAERRAAERRFRRQPDLYGPPLAADVEAEAVVAQRLTREDLAAAVAAWAAMAPATDLVHDLDVARGTGPGWDLDVDEVDVMDGGHRGPVDRLHGIPTLTTPTITTVAAFTPTGKPITVAITATITPR